MPLRVAEASIQPATLTEGNEDVDYLIFFSSLVDGRLWCPDCLAVDELVQKTFKPIDGPSALMVHVGDKPTWKSPSNLFKGEPWKIRSIPTIIKLRDTKEIARLDDDATFGRKLIDFMNEAR